MLSNKKFTAAMLAFAIMGLISSVSAQGPPSMSGQSLFPNDAQPHSLAEQLDGLARKVFGVPDEAEAGAKAPRTEAMHRPASKPAARNSGFSTLDNILNFDPKSLLTGDQPTQGSSTTGHRAKATPNSRLGSLTGRSIEQAQPADAAEATTSLPAESARAADALSDASSSSQPVTDQERISVVDDPMLRPLHERLTGFRKSTFDEASLATPTSEPSSVPSPVVAPQQTASTAPAAVPPRGDSPSTQEDPFRLGQPQPSAAAEQRPLVAPRNDGLLFVRKSPGLSVQTAGPRQITVGKESTYKVTIENDGEVEAEDVVVSVALPAWADVVDSQVSTGSIQTAAPGQGPQPLRWQIPHLAAQGRHRLALKIVPRESRPFDLAVRWDYQPAASQAMIEVQEPKLAIALDGPQEVLYGEKEVYTLMLTNTGNGDAEDVNITLVPIGADGSQPVTHNLGTIEAGQHKSLHVELTARQVGDLVVKVEARGDGGLFAESAKKVVVRRAALQVDVEGPKVQYVGATAGYRIRVRNPGTATARNLRLSVSLPPSAAYLSGIEDAQVEADGTKLQWNLNTLAPASEKAFLLNCRLDAPGSTQIDVASTADGDLAASAGMTTRVEAVADLTLDVSDPVGPVPVGEDADFEVHVRNRGTKTASDIQVVTYFSDGIEPVSADGARHEIQTGQVVFGPLLELAAGEDLLLRVSARAETSGDHVCRVEVHCKPLGTRLVCEETTRFYQEDSGPRPASPYAPLASPVTPVASPMTPTAQPPSGVFQPTPPAEPVTAGRPTLAPALPR